MKVGLLKHSQSDHHRRASAAYEASLIPSGQSLAETTLKKINEVDMSRMKKLFLAAYSLAQRKRPFTDSVPLLDLGDMWDVDLDK